MASVLWLIPSLIVSCASIETSKRVAETDRCSELAKQIDWTAQISSLNKITDLFHNQCYKETIVFANVAKELLGDKTYSLTNEALELFTYEGAVTDYVLESYERGYLTFLTTASYFHLNQSGDVTVELNKFYSEETAFAYNYGQDHVNALIQAAMWDNFHHEGFSSRPFWLWLVHSNETDPQTLEFAKHRIEQIDHHIEIPKWQIWEIGSFPTILWSTSFLNAKNGYLELHPGKPFQETCRHDQTLMVSTASWFGKIAIRHSHRYHPLVNVKSWMRLPLGVAFGVMTVGGGVGVMASGCALDVALKGSGELCKASIHGGAEIMSKSKNAVRFALKPDLRHWENLPASILITPSIEGDKTCVDNGTQAKFRVL